MDDNVSFSTISSPNLAISSSLVVGLWHPVEMTMVTSASGFPFLISLSIGGTMTLLGTGLVWSDQISTTFLFP